MKEAHSDYLDYIVISSYKNAHTNMKFKHLKCGRIIEMTPNSFLNGRGCIYCSRKVTASKQLKSIDKVKESLPQGIELVGKYMGAHKKSKVHCNRCNQTYYVAINDLKRHGRCTHCSGRYNENTEMFKQDVYNLVGNEYKVIGEYRAANIKIKMLHTICGNSYEVTPHNFKHNRRCPYCIESRGEKTIRDILINHHINFEEQKTFDDCYDINKLSYDFYVPEYKLLIEYQGKQHYKPVKFFGGQKHYIIQQRHDLIKKIYAKSNNYNLLTIPYRITSYSSIEKYINAFVSHEILGN